MKHLLLTSMLFGAAAVAEDYTSEAFYEEIFSEVGASAVQTPTKPQVKAVVATPAPPANVSSQTVTLFDKKTFDLNSDGRSDEIHLSEENGKVVLTVLLDGARPQKSTLSLVEHHTEYSLGYNQKSQAFWVVADYGRSGVGFWTCSNFAFRNGKIVVSGVHQKFEHSTEPQRNYDRSVNLLSGKTIYNGKKGKTKFAAPPFQDWSFQLIDQIW